MLFLQDHWSSRLPCAFLPVGVMPPRLCQAGFSPQGSWQPWPHSYREVAFCPIESEVIAPHLETELGVFIIFEFASRVILSLSSRIVQVCIWIACYITITWCLKSDSFPSCYSLNICVSLNCVCWKLIPSVMVFGGGGGLWEVIRSWMWSPHNESNVFMKEVITSVSIGQKATSLQLWGQSCQEPWVTKSSLADSIESSLTSFAMRGYNEKTDVFEPGSRSSPNTESVGDWILDFWASRTMKQICIVYDTQTMIFCSSTP